MSRPRIIQPGQSYTFSKYFELPFSPEDILAELGCSYQRERLQLPKTEFNSEIIAEFIYTQFRSSYLYRTRGRNR